MVGNRLYRHLLVSLFLEASKREKQIQTLGARQQFNMMYNSVTSRIQDEQYMYFYRVYKCVYRLEVSGLWTIFSCHYLFRAGKKIIKSLR